MADAEKPDPSNPNPTPTARTTQKGEADHPEARMFASHYLRRYGKLCQIVHQGWDKAQQLHIFEGMIEPGCRGNYIHFTIHIRPTPAGKWEVACKKLG